jgi:predicted RecA/RadA family phage recombinase
MFEAQYLTGDPLMVEHTPGSAVAAGDVVVVGNTPRIAHRPIPANEPGALAAGGGVYLCKAQAGSDVGAGVKVFWDNTNNVVSTTATGNLAFGFTVAAITKATYGAVVHQPDGVAAA